MRTSFIGKPLEVLRLLRGDRKKKRAEFVTSFIKCVKLLTYYGIVRFDEVDN
jgi:hypothetical protein